MATDYNPLTDYVPPPIDPNFDQPVAPSTVGVGAAPPAAPTSTFWGSLPSLAQGIANIGLQVGTAATKGFAGPLVTPQPVQATASANVASLLSTGGPILLIGLLVLGGVFLLRRKK